MNRILFFVFMYTTYIGDGSAQPSTFLKMYNRGNSGFVVREQNGNSFLVAGGTNYYYNYHWMQQSPVAMTNVHLFKTTSQGSLLWENVYSNPASRTIGIWMEPTADGGAIVTGRANSDVLWPPDSNNIILLKTDAAGALSWSKSFDTGKDELGYCVRQTSDGGYAVSGFHDALPVSLIGNTYALLIKTDANGNITWSRKYQLPVRDFDTGESFPVVFRQTADGGYVLISTTFGSHQADICVIRADSSGNLVWANSYEHDNTMFRLSVGLDIIENQAGELIVAGAMDKNRAMNQYNYPFIMKLDASGNLVDAKILSSVPDMMFQSGFSSVEQTADGGYFFTGMGGYGGFGDQAQLLKTDNLFNMQWSRVYTWDGVATMGARSARSTSDGCYIFTGKRQFNGTVVMKTNSVGMIPCKNPGTLTEIIPSVMVVGRTPPVLSGINAVPFPMNAQAFITDTSEVCPVIISTLPVALLSFTAERINGTLIRLEWTTGSESDLDRFVVERSAMNGSFHGIGYMKSGGNSTGLRNYSFDDVTAPPSGALAYRLRQVDVNGDFEYSPVAVVKGSGPGSGQASVFAYAGEGTLHLYLNNCTCDNMHYRVTDVAGITIREGELRSGTHSGNHQWTIATGTMPHGLYFFSVWSDTISLKGKFYY